MVWQCSTCGKQFTSEFALHGHSAHCKPSGDVSSSSSKVSDLEVGKILEGLGVGNVSVSGGIDLRISIPAERILAFLSGVELQPAQQQQQPQQVDLGWIMRIIEMGAGIYFLDKYDKEKRGVWLWVGLFLLGLGTGILDLVLNFRSSTLRDIKTTIDIARGIKGLLS